MFVCASRGIAMTSTRVSSCSVPSGLRQSFWGDGISLTEQELKELWSLPMVNMVMTRGQDDEQAMYDLLVPRRPPGSWTSSSRTPNPTSRSPSWWTWLTGFDVPEASIPSTSTSRCKDNLIQTISPGQPPL